MANGYIGVALPRGMPGSAGPQYVGQEHIKGVFTSDTLLPHSYDSGAGPDHAVSLAPLASWTATAYVSAIGGAAAHATASALDLQRGVYEVVTPHSPLPTLGGNRSHCVQRTFAHYSLPHVLVTEFSCMNRATAALSITIKQRRCPDSINQSVFTPMATLCPKLNASTFTHGHTVVTRGTEMGYRRADEPSGMEGVTCTRSTMHVNESPDLAPAVVGECHSEVPAEGLTYTVPATQTLLVSLVSARFTSMDAGVSIGSDGKAALNPTGADPVAQSKAAWSAANGSAATLFARHAAAIAALNAPGVEVAGNLELARVVNASMYSLLGSYRADSPYSSAPEGLVSARYGGWAFWDVETWQLPTWLVFFPQQARAALQYRVDRMHTARRNARTPVYPGAAPRAGLKYPTESAVTGVEQCVGNMEDHVQGDIALALRQYFYATGDTAWLRESGFPVMAGIAAYYASRLTEGSDGLLHILHTTGPDEYASEKDAKLAQTLGQLQPFIAVFPQECVGQLASFGPT